MSLGVKSKRFFRSLRPRLSPSDLKRAEETLGPQMYRLFESMDKADIAHSLAVLNSMEKAGKLEDWQRQAVLLHDVGKAESRPRVFDRVAFDLLNRMAPRLLLSLMKQRNRLARVMVIMYNHPMLGRRKVGVLSDDERLLEAIERHHAGADDAFIAALKKHDAKH